MSAPGESVIARDMCPGMRLIIRNPFYEGHS